MNWTSTLAAAIAVFSLAACSGSGSESSAAENGKIPATASDSGTPTVFRNQLDALGKAKDVNRTVEEQAERQRRAIDEQGR